MNEEKMNMDIRKLLKQFGVTSQQKIDHVIFKAIEEGKLQGNESFDVKIRLEIPALNLSHEIDGRIALE